MRRSRLLTVCVALISGVGLSGCAGESSRGEMRDVAQTGPHGGPMFSLPEGLGTAEVVIEPIKGVGRMNAERVVAYILAADMDTSSPAHPTDVRIRLEYPDREAQTLPLQPDSAPQGSGRFVSQPGTYMVEPLIGELTMTLGGREVNGRFAGAR